MSQKVIKRKKIHSKDSLGQFFDVLSTDQKEKLGVGKEKQFSDLTPREITELEREMGNESRERARDTAKSKVPHIRYPDRKEPNGEVRQYSPEEILLEGLRTQRKRMAHKSRADTSIPYTAKDKILFQVFTNARKKIDAEAPIPWLSTNDIFNYLQTLEPEKSYNSRPSVASRVTEMFKALGPLGNTGSCYLVRKKFGRMQYMYKLTNDGENMTPSQLARLKYMFMSEIRSKKIPLKTEGDHIVIDGRRMKNYNDEEVEGENENIKDGDEPHTQTEIKEEEIVEESSAIERKAAELVIPLLEKLIKGEISVNGNIKVDVNLKISIE